MASPGSAPATSKQINFFLISILLVGRYCKDIGVWFGYPVGVRLAPVSCTPVRTVAA